MASNSILDSFDPKGHIEIFKIYPNGRRELFYSDHNEITVGMGITLASLYSAPKTDPLDDYQISHFISIALNCTLTLRPFPSRIF